MNVIRCKVALIGDPRVGKTSIVNQLVKNSFNGTYQTTLGVEYNQFEVKIKETNYTVQFHILDCTGFSAFRELINKVITDVNFILYVYDSTNLESFQSIKAWKETVNQMNIKSNVVEYLVGNKIEIPEKVVTDKVSVENLAKKLNLKSSNSMSKSHITSGASLTLNSKLEEKKRNLEEKIKLLAKENLDNLLEYAKQNGAKVYFIKKQ